MEPQTSSQIFVTGRYLTRVARLSLGFLTFNLVSASTAFGKFLPNDPDTYGGSARSFWWAVLTLVLAFYLANRASSRAERGAEFEFLKVFFGVQIISLILFINFGK
jgi:hypothetical protein